MFMNPIRALLGIVFGILLLMTLWPIFLLLVFIMIIYWIFIKSKFKQMVKETQTEQTKSSSAIDADYTERKE